MNAVRVSPLIFRPSRSIVSYRIIFPPTIYGMDQNNADFSWLLTKFWTFGPVASTTSENSRRRKLTSTYGNGATNGARCTCDSTNFALLTTSKPVGTPSLAFHPTQLTEEAEWLLKFYLDSDPAVAAAPTDSVGENSRGIDPNHRVGHKLYKELYRQTVII